MRMPAMQFAIAGFVVTAVHFSHENETTGLCLAPNSGGVL